MNGTTALDSTTTITGTLNQTGNAVLSGTTTFTGAMNATALSSGSIASGKYIGLNTSNQLVLASATGGATMALSGLTSAQSTNTENNAAYAQTWTWNSISTQTGLTISTTSPLTGGTLVNLSATAASATSTGKILSISNSTTGAGYGIYSAMTATGNTGLPIAGVNGGTNNQGAAIYGLNNSTSGWGEYQAGSSPNYFAGTVVVGAGAVVSLLNGYLYSNSTGETVLYMNSAGCCWGTMQNTNSNSWSLGYSSNSNGTLGTSVLTWTTSGDVGIGTSLPDSTSHETTFTVNDTNGNAAEFNLDITGTGNVAGWIAYDGGSAMWGGVFNFYTTDGYFYMDANGNLTVNSLYEGISDSITLYGPGSNGQTATLNFLDTQNYIQSTYGGNIIVNSYNGMNLQVNHSATTGLFINTSGEVGIGTTSPGYTLDVNGEIHVGTRPPPAAQAFAETLTYCPPVPPASATRRT